jgi:hypothetical protein
LDFDRWSSSKTFISQIRFHTDVFGAVWNNGRSRLVFIPRKSNPTTYLKHVQLAVGNYSLDLRHYCFIHNRTTWSYTDMIHQWLIDNDITYLDDYPSASPQLNAIEPVLGWMKHFVHSCHPKSQQQLENFVLRA